ncbi:unnamed protein product [Discosporangium mesarthrocarpum]
MLDVKEGMQKMTAEKRKKVREDQKSLRTEIIARREDVSNLSSEAFSEVTRKNRRIFKEGVFYTREAVTDIENVRLIASQASLQVKTVNQGAQIYDPSRFLTELRKSFLDPSTLEFNWGMLGTAVGVGFSRVPTGPGFMMGPIDKPAKAKVARQRREKANDRDVEAVVPEKVEAAGKGAKRKKDETELRISHMRELAFAKGSVGKKRDMFEMLINPKSFTQTVENIFDFSFFIKSGEASVTLSKETGLPEVEFFGQTPTTPPAEQWIFTLTKAEFNELVDLYQMEDSFLPHRPESRKTGYYDPLAS